MLFRYLPLVLGVVVGSGLANPLGPTKYPSRGDACRNICHNICRESTLECLCSEATRQMAIACATCAVQEGEDDARKMQEALNYITKECARGGSTIASIVILTSSAFVLASLVPTQTSSAVITTPVPNLNSVVSISPSTAPTPNATSVTHGNVVLIASVISGVAFAALAAAISVWWTCVRRRRRTRLDLGDDEVPGESKASSTHDMDTSTSLGSMIDLKSRGDHIPLLRVSHNRSGQESSGNISSDPLLSPSARSDGRTWASAEHASGLSDDGRPFVVAKKGPRPVLSTRIPATDDPTADLVSGQELDRIATTIASMLSTQAPSLPAAPGKAPPMYDDTKRM